METKKIAPLDHTSIEWLKDSYEVSRTTYEYSILESREAVEMFHNRQYTSKQLNELAVRGQPAETFNVIKLMTNALLGFFGTVANTVQVKPNNISTAASAILLNDVAQYVLKYNKYDKLQLKLKRDLLLTGLCVVKEEAIESGAFDDYGRKLYNIDLKYIRALEVALDPMSREDDYSDARFIHRYRWMHEDEVRELWPDEWNKMTDKYNYLGGRSEEEFEREFKRSAVGFYQYQEHFLIVHTCVKDNKGDFWEIVWHDEIQLEKKKTTFRKNRFPYRVTKLQESDTAEHYGVFREVAESQKAINQAILQIQLLANTTKAIIEEEALATDMTIKQFTALFNKINSIIPVKDIAGIRIEDMSRDIMKQYSLIDKAVERIKSVLGVNDSFLGNAYASDSGRKVQIQKQSSFAQMTWLVSRVELMNELIGEDVVDMIQQYFTANQVLRIVDPIIGEKWISINQPLMSPVMDPRTGTPKLDPMTGQPVMQPLYDEVLNPESGEPEEDEDGNLIIAPINSLDSDIGISDVAVTVESVAYNNYEERNQLLFETFLQGPVGQSLLQIDPASYFTAASMQLSEYGTKSAPQLAEILKNVAIKVSGGQLDPSLAMVGGDMQSIMGGAMGGNTGNHQNPKSQRLQVPTGAGTERS